MQAGPDFPVFLKGTELPLTEAEMKYRAYSDESYVNERYRSIATFSFRAECGPELNSKLMGILGESDVSEFKWHKLKTARYRFCAEKLLDALFDAVQSFDARVDVLIWDTCDSRHQIADRDDAANYGRMYFHLHNQAMKRRPKGSEWSLYPDEQVEIDWKTVNQCLGAVGRRRQYIDSPLFGGFFSNRYYQIQELCPVESHRTPCCQVADLLAGLSVFSKTHYDQYEK